jgi:hypothetical protein
MFGFEKKLVYPQQNTLASILKVYFAQFHNPGNVFLMVFADLEVLVVLFDL